MASQIRTQQHKTLSSVAVQKILQDIDSIIAERKQELSNIRQRSNNNSINNSFHSFEKNADDYITTTHSSVNRNKNSAIVANVLNENIGGTPKNIINHDIDSCNSGDNLATPYNLEYSISQPHSASTVDHELLVTSNSQLDFEDPFPQLDGTRRLEFNGTVQSSKLEDTDTNDSARISLPHITQTNENIGARVIDDSSVNSSFLADSIASEEQQRVRVSPEECNQPKLSVHHQALKEDSMSETFSFGEFEELEELMEDNDQSGFRQALDDGSLSSCNLNYNAIYGRAESGLDSSASISRNAGSSRNNSISSSLGVGGDGNGVICEPKRVDAARFSYSQVNPQHQLTIEKKQKQQQEQLHLTRQKNELLEKRLHDIEKLIDSDFSEHSLQTKMLNNERSKLWSSKVALEEELEEMKEELLLVRSQLQSKSIRANELEIKLQEVQQRLDAQIQEKQRVSHHLLLVEREAAVEKERANNLAAELSQVQESILELSTQLSRQQTVSLEQRVKETCSDNVAEGVQPLAVELALQSTEEEQPTMPTEPSALAEVEEQLQSALIENDMLAKCLEEILWERNELVDRLEQAKVVVLERDDAIEQMRSMLISAQGHVKQEPNISRPPIVARTWVVNEEKIPVIKKSFVLRLITGALFLLCVWTALLVGLIAYTSTGRLNCSDGSAQCPLDNFVTS